MALTNQYCTSELMIWIVLLGKAITYCSLLGDYRTEHVYVNTSCPLGWLTAKAAAARDHVR